jgi:hypothetical protein
MSKTVFSSELFEQMGGVNWLTRPGGFEFYPQNRHLDAASDNEIGNDSVDDVKVTEDAELVDAASDQVEKSVLSPEVAPIGDDASSAESILPTPEPHSEKVNHSMQHSTQEIVPNIQSEEPLENHQNIPLNNLPNIVVLGAGLDGFWQNEETQAWQLWQNIMLAFDWDESQMIFFDTTHLVSDEMIFTTMEEVIDLGVDWVLTMDEDHPISEQLVEGVHVVSVPDLESMLSDPYAKQSFYHAVLALNSAH